MNPFENIGQMVMVPGNFFQGLNQQQPVDRGVDVPPRVRLAMDFLQRLSAKTGQGGVPHGHGCSPGGVEVIEGQKLTGGEQHAQLEALGVIEKYMNGTLRECRWDRPFKDEPEEVITQLKIQCPSCRGTMMEGPEIGKMGRCVKPCMVCGGVGYVQVARAVK